MASHSCPSVESINSPDSTPNLSFSKTVSSLKPVSSKYLNKSFGYTISINWRSKLFYLVVILCTFSYSKAHTFLVILNTGFSPLAEFFIGCGVVHYTFRICPISLAAVDIDSCPIWLEPHRMRFFTLVLGLFQLFHMHIRIRLRNHWSMVVSDVFASAYLKYDTNPRMTWCSAAILRSYPIPLLLPVSILSFVFSLSKILGWTRNLQPSPVL